jgi:chromosome partitioning protein
MAIFVVCNEKGGAGKSSIAQTFAVFLSLKKHQDVLLVDADPQRTSSDWAAERQNIYPPVPCIELTGNIAQTLIDLRDRYEGIIVDCGGADSKAMRSALAVADMAILPFRPKRRDLKVAATMADIIETARAMNSNLNVVSAITQAPVQPNQRYRIENAQRVLLEFGLAPLKNITRNLNAWDDAEEMGCSVIEYTGDDKAKLDACNLFEELLGVINHG